MNKEKKKRKKGIRFWWCITVVLYALAFVVLRIANHLNHRPFISTTVLWLSILAFLIACVGFFISFKIACHKCERPLSYLVILYIPFHAIFFKFCPRCGEWLYEGRDYR